MKITGNEPANATSVCCNDNGIYSNMDCKTAYEGLTIRHQFAMAAMQGILTAQAGTRDMVIMQAEYFAETYPGKTMRQAIASESVSQADALISELNRTEADNGTNGN